MCLFLHGKVDRSGEQVPERAERFRKAMDAPGIVDAATDSPNAPERGGGGEMEAALGQNSGCNGGWSGPGPVWRE